MTKWIGEGDVGKAFDAFRRESEIIPSSSCPSVKDSVKACLKHIAEYKMVVFEIEKRMKATEESRDRLKALFVIDGLLSQTNNKVKEQLQTRFSGRMKQICGLLENVEGEEYLTFVQIVSKWRESGTFSDSVLPSIQRSDNDNTSKAQSIGSVASSSSGKEKELKREGTKIKQKKSATTTKIIKYCSFREGSCPFGEKCRFSHAAQGTNYDISKRPITRLEDAPESDLARAKYARLSITSISTARGAIRPSILEKIREEEDRSRNVSFTRNPMDVYTTRTDVQVSCLSADDFAQLK